MFDLIPYLRQFRVGPFAIFDIAISYLGIYLLSPLLIKLFAKIHVRTTLSTWMFLTLPIGVIFHVVFSQNTPLMKMLLDLGGHYLEKAILLSMVVMGIRSMQVIKAK